MCGRFALTTPHSAVIEHFAASPVAGLVDEGPRYNICPTQGILAVRQDEAGARALDRMRWGFVPRWAKSLSDGPLLINARAETIHEKPAFREACRARRCLIPADGFYEWRAESGAESGAKSGKGKQPFYIHARGRNAPLAFAGVWQAWRDPATGAEIRTTAIVTCDANATLRPLHDRMPVVIAPESYGLWLGEEGAGAAALMRPAPEDLFVFHPVDRAVSAARNDSPDLMAPIDG
jgi:putative SOS response-associated peptidase YedK